MRFCPTSPLFLLPSSAALNGWKRERVKNEAEFFCIDSVNTDQMGLAELKTISSPLAEEKPPRVMVSVARGHAALGPAGEVLAYPDAIVDLDCVFNRVLGNPEWQFKRKNKDYAIGERARDRSTFHDLRPD